MQRRAIIKIAGLLSFVAVILVLAAACARGIPQAEFDAVKQQLTAKEQEVAKLQAGQATAQQQLASKEAEIADLKKRAEAAAKVRTLVGAEPKPTPAPRATATPVPPGYVAPTPTPRPAYLFEPVPFTVYVETLATTSVSRYGLASTVPCIPNHVFQRGMKLVWRFDVFDTKTGKRITEQDKATIKVRLPHGEERPTRFSARGGIGPWMWGASWDIPPDYPLGSLDYAIVISHPDGRTFTWKEPALVRAATATAAGIDSKLQIIE